VKDAEIDKAAGVKTLAQRIGTRRSLIAGTAGFSATYVLLLVNLHLDYPPVALLVPMVLVAVHVVTWIKLRPTLLTSDARTLRTYRTVYRSLFVLLGIWLVVIALGAARLPVVH
jgi:4-hydroxybenzoate polyprenyltransferase